MAAILLLYLVLLTSSTPCWAETCLAGTITTDHEPAEDDPPYDGYVHININEPAACSGTVRGWSVCFEPATSKPIVIAMYRSDESGTYTIVEGSYHKLILDIVESPTCKNISLQPLEHFAVEENDVVGLCEEHSTYQYYEKLGNSLLKWPAGSCSESRVSPRGTITDRRNRIFLLSAIIGSGIGVTPTSSPPSTAPGAVAGIIGGIMAFLLISAAAIATVLVFVCYYCARKHKRHTHETSEPIFMKKLGQKLLNLLPKQSHPQCPVPSLQRSMKPTC